MRALVIEDNPKMATGLQLGLQAAGFVTDISHSGVEGEGLATVRTYDVIVLDLMLPDRDGIEVCRNLRQRKIATPLIMLTALGSTEDKINGLDAGADDFLAKPFKFPELLARIRALVRRGPGAGGKVLRCEDLELDLYSRRAKRAGEQWDLPAREFSLLEYLLRNQDQTLSRIQIGQHVWQMAFEPTSNVIDVYVSALRKKIDRPGLTPLIHTVKNSGYRLGTTP
jgi:DNA-binding response OmpR family regulator